MRRKLCTLLVLAAYATACAQDRPRPFPTELPEEGPTLRARVVAPLSNSTVLSTQVVAITVLGQDTAESTLTGVGIVARIRGEMQDSVVVRFNPRSDSSHVFMLTVPDQVTNTRFDVQAVAFGQNNETAVSGITRLIIVRCGTGVPGC